MSVLGLMLAACTPKGPAPEPVEELRFELPGGGELVLPLERFTLGIVEPPEQDDLSYDPVYVNDIPTLFVAPDEAWQTPAGVVLSYPDGRLASLTLQPRQDGWVQLHWSVNQPEDVGFFRFVANGDPNEGFYGLGETFDSPEHRGRIRDMHIEPDGLTESGYNEAHVPIPFVIGTTGWGLFVQDDHLMRFEVATEADDEVQITVGTGVMSDRGLLFHVYTAEHPLDLTRLYYETTGYPAVPAPWALGPILWRNANIDQAEVIGDIDAMRALDLAMNALWIDRPYASGVNSFDFLPADYPDPQGMIDHAHDMGMRMGLWHTPYADEEEAPAIHAEAVAGGYYPPLEPEAILLFVNWGPLIDFTNPEASAWWTDHVRAYTDMGIEGFKLDFAEDIVPAALSHRLAWEFHDGSDERTMHRHYQRLYHQAYRAALDDGPDAGFLLNRAGAWGDQTVTSIIWPGDIDGNLAEHGEDLGTFVAVGGLPAAVCASIGLGPSGYPFFGSDTGGYRHTPPDKETFTRWFEHTALSSVMQIGMGSSDVAWEFVNDWDDAMLDDYREYTRLHLRLFPYIWTYAQQIEQTGHPIQRPLGLAHPELGEHPPFDYLFGEHLLVAPVVKAGETTRRVLLPAGDWVDWFDGDVRAAGEHTVDAPLSKIPLFLHRGGMVPMLRPTIDTLVAVADPATIDSFDADAGVLYVRVFPGDPTTFTLYDGTVLTQSLDGTTATLGYTAGTVFTQGVEFEILGFGAPVFATLTADGETTAAL